MNLQISHFLPLESCPERHGQGGFKLLWQFRICIAHPDSIHERLWEVRVAPETSDSESKSEQTRQPACSRNAKNSPRPFWDRIILEKTWNELVSASDLLIVLLRFYFIDCLVYCCCASDLDCVDLDRKTSGTVSQQIDAGFWQVQKLCSSVHL